MRNRNYKSKKRKDINEHEVDMYTKVIEESIFGTFCNYMDKLIDYILD